MHQWQAMVLLLAAHSFPASSPICTEAESFLGSGMTAVWLATSVCSKDKMLVLVLFLNWNKLSLCEFLFCFSKTNELLPNEVLNVAF